MTDKNDKPVVHFASLQSVEDYVEQSGKFRTNCTSFTIPGRDSGGANAVYIPYCEKQRFDFGHQLNDYRGHGVFKPPEKGKRWEIPDFVLYREHFHSIHCPQSCQGYRNKRVVALLEKFRWRAPTAGPPVPTTGKWTRKEIVTAVVVPVVVALVAALLGWLTPEGRRLLHLDKPQPEQHTSSPAPPQLKPDSGPVEVAPSTKSDRATATRTETKDPTKRKLREAIGNLIQEGTKIRDGAPVWVGDAPPDITGEWKAWTAKVQIFLKGNFDSAEVQKFRSLDDPNTSLNSKIHSEIADLEQLLDRVGQ